MTDSKDSDLAQRFAEAIDNETSALFPCDAEWLERCAQACVGVVRAALAHEQQGEPGVQPRPHLAHNIEILRSLPHGWDSYSGKPPTDAALKALANFCIVPMPSGGVQVECHQDGWDIEIGIAADGTLDPLAEHECERNWVLPRVDVPADAPEPPQPEHDCGLLCDSPTCTAPATPEGGPELDHDAARLRRILSGETDYLDEGHDDH